MKTVLKIFIAFSVSCTMIARSQKSPHDYSDDTPEIGHSNAPGYSEKMRQFMSTCPRGCQCLESSYGLEADCSQLSLSEVPKDLSPLTECLDLSMNNITKITAESFAGLKQLKKLCLSGNFITELPQDVFTGFRKMKVLVLQDNSLTTIPPNTVSKMPNLKDLNLGANYIKTISSNAFARLDSLELLWLDDNALVEIPSRALKKVPTIKALSLVMNEITTVRKGDLDQLQDLNVLLLKHNAISEIENNAFERSTNIQIIDLSYNNLTSPPPAIKDVQKLRELSLSYNKIQTLPDLAFAGNPDLCQLSLTGNPIKSVGKMSFTGLINLQELTLENAEDLKEFPDLSGCKQLTALSITGGKIRTIPSSLCASLPSLKSLTLSNNRLKNISGLLRCSNLTELDVSENELTNFTSSETRNMTKLRNLNLGSNQIRHLGVDVFSKMNHIEKLNLAHNFFTFLPIRGLGSLRELNISGVHTLLYLPPVDLFHNLRSLAAHYPYHCCQVAKIPKKIDHASFIYNYPQSGLHLSPLPPHGDYFPPMSSPVQCSPGPGPMTPCDDLLPSTPLRVFWWCAMVVAFLLNGIILLACGLRYCVRRRTRSTTIPSDEEMLGRAETDSPFTDSRMVVYDSEMHPSHYCLNFTRGSRSMRSESDTFDVALCHLALSDFIVTAYTAVLLTYDRATQGEFAEQGAWWQQSALCHSAGFLLTFGTQLAFSTVAVMAVERYLATMYPLQTERHIRKNVLLMALSAAWVISLATATVTLFGNAGDSESDKIIGMLPAKTGATCLPWMTKFAYIAVLVGFHVIVCIVVCFVCALMFCARRKQSWLSARKSTRRQVTLAVVFNVMLILPLAILALYVSGLMTYSDLIVFHAGKYSSANDGGIMLDMGRVLAFAMFVIPFRPLLNPILYFAFNKPLRRDLAYLGKKIIIGDTKPRRPTFPQRRNSILETMFDSPGNLSQEGINDFNLFAQSTFDHDLLQQAVAYDNRGIVSTSSVSYHAPSVSLAPSTGRRVGGSHRSSSERRRRRRYTRSRRTERRTTDTDPTTESEVITFHRGGDAVFYNPESRERRKKKLSVRCGGVNAKDEFQRLVFPRVANSSDHGSDSTVYQIMPAKRSAAMTTSCDRQTSQESSSKHASPKDDQSDASSKSCALVRRPDYCQHPKEHYDLSALNTFYEEDTSTELTAPIPQNFSREASSTTADTSYDADMEVSEICSAISPDSQEENPFFDDRDTAKRLHEPTRRKTHQRARSHDEECQPSTSREVNDLQQTNIRYPLAPSLRKDRAASHSSGNSDVHLIGRMGTGNSCEYCDSATSKDSGIHSEIDSTSGASYSDTSIGRRLHFSTSGALKSIDISTIGEREVDLYELASYAREYRVAPNITDADTDQATASPISNPETTI